MNGDYEGENGGAGRNGVDDTHYQTLVEVAARLLDADLCEYLAEEGNRLVVRASSEDTPGESDRSYSLHMGMPGMAYSSDAACVVDDVDDTRGATAAWSDGSAPYSEYRSLLCVPFPREGLLVAKAKPPASFSEGDLDIVDGLAEVVRKAPSRQGPQRLPLLNGGTPDHADYPDRLEEIADILSHDLKNPLNVAAGNLELARESGEDEYFDRTEGALDRIESLIDEVVFLARTGEYVEETEVVDLRERAQTAWDNVQTHEATLDIEGTVSFSASGSGVSHLLENLIENAVAHGGPNVLVRIGVTDGGFYVEDDGPGIPSEHRERVFDRGFTIESDTSGFGLHIVNRIAEAHGWGMTVGSSSTGGARFEITGVDVRDVPT